MPLAGILFIAFFVMAFGCGILFLASKLGSGIKDRVKFQTYECGLPSEEKLDTKVSVKFYLTAILFILFDIEVIFMYPWALSFQDFLGTTEGVAAFSSMMIFLLIFIFGLVWEIKSKALDWN